VGTAYIHVFLTGSEHRFLPHYAFSGDNALQAISIGDMPFTGEQLNRVSRFIDDFDLIGENVVIMFGGRFVY
jgi:hypothetical protein